MLKIGDLSKLSQVPIKTLRYYDEIGLLKPSEVDRFTSYRYYTLAQIPRLNRILAFKDLGFSLEQIAELLDENLSVEQIRGMLRMKRAEIERNLEEEQARLTRVEARLRQIERENQMPVYEIVLKTIPPMRAACFRQITPSYEGIGQLYGELFMVLGQNGILPSGPLMGIYHDPEYREQDTDVEAVIPIPHTRTFPHPRIQVRDLAGVLVASLVRPGPYDDFHSAYQALIRWVQTNGYHLTGPNREVYLHGPWEGISSGDFLTEIQFPVAKEKFE
ncbi:MAG: MerR family transcriptional regulator [Anaerolineales bacterium]